MFPHALRDVCRARVGRLFVFAPVGVAIVALHWSVLVRDDAYTGFLALTARWVQ